jgi:hypothetical protein
MYELLIVSSLACSVTCRANIIMNTLFMDTTSSSGSVSTVSRLGIRGRGREGGVDVSLNLKFGEQYLREVLITNLVADSISNMKTKVPMSQVCLGGNEPRCKYSTHFRSVFGIHQWCLVCLLNISCRSFEFHPNLQSLHSGQFFPFKLGCPCNFFHLWDTFHI